MKIPLKVLIVEDSRDDAELLLYALKQAGFQPSYALVQNAQGMRAQLGKQNWDLVISDYVIPGFGGMAALKVLTQDLISRSSLFPVRSVKTLLSRHSMVAPTITSLRID
jgi:DNA-binding NtrC family response regulator